MKKTKTRTFVPCSPYVGNSMVKTIISKYTWTKSRGLRVHYKDRMRESEKSEYTLRELLGKDKPAGPIKEIFDVSE